jgi:hypothetical protein
MLQNDGATDPEGIKIRPIEGLDGCSYLDPSIGALTSSLSYVFGPLIDILKVLQEIGSCVCRQSLIRMIHANLMINRAWATMTIAYALPHTIGDCHRRSSSSVTSTLLAFVQRSKRCTG